MRHTRAVSLPAIVLLVLCVCGSATARDEGFDIQRALHLSEKGMRALRTNNLKKAESLFQKALVIVPQYPGALVGHGHIAMRERHFVEALDAFRQAEEGYRVLGDALLDVRLATFNRAQDRMAAIRNRIDDLDRVLNRQENIQASGRRSNAPGPNVSALRSEKTRLERELEELRLLRPPVAGDSDPVPGEIHFHIGNALLNLGRLEEAIHAWERCVEKAPDFPLVHYNLAVAYWKIQRHAEARASLERSEALGFDGNPNFRRDLEQALARGVPVGSH